MATPTQRLQELNKGYLKHFNEQKPGDLHIGRYKQKWEVYKFVGWDKMEAEYKRIGSFDTFEEAEALLLSPTLEPPTNQLNKAQ